MATGPPPIADGTFWECHLPAHIYIYIPPLLTGGTSIVWDLGLCQTPLRWTNLVYSHLLQLLKYFLICITNSLSTSSTKCPVYIQVFAYDILLSSHVFHFYEIFLKLSVPATTISVKLDINPI